MNEYTGRVFLKNGTVVDVGQFDDSFLSGTGYIYEVFRVIDGVPLFLEDHIERLEKSASLTGMMLPFAHKELSRQVMLLTEANRLQEGNIKIVFVPADQGGQGLFLMYVTPHQYPDSFQFRDGVSVVLMQAIRKNPNAKVMDTPLRRKSNQLKSEEDVYETLLVDHDGCITEGSRSNVFFIAGDGVITPPVDDVLPGITRKHIMDCCHREGIPLREQRMPVINLGKVEAAFLSGTSRKVLPINRIDDMAFNAGHPVIRRLQHAFNTEVSAYLQHAVRTRNQNDLPE
jgi:branched-chain amino acid aminotransferase